jgi:hypothetical protein
MPSPILRSRKSFTYLVALTVALLTGCYAAVAPKFTVLGVQSSPARLRVGNRNNVVVVQVTNPIARPLRLQRLEYTFAASQGASKAEQRGELLLARDIPASSAVVVEVPLDSDEHGAMTLTGRLYTQRDQVVTSYAISAQVPAQ